MVTTSLVRSYFHTNKQGSVIAMSGTSAALTEGPYTSTLTATASPAPQPVRRQVSPIASLGGVSTQRQASTTTAHAIIHPSSAVFFKPIRLDTPRISTSTLTSEMIPRIVRRQRL